MKKVKVFIVLLIMGIGINSFAHEGHNHNKKDTVQNTVEQKDTVLSESDEMNNLKPEGFPTLHPLVVHFPIVLLMVAALLQIIGLFNRKNSLNYVTLFILAAGTLCAYLSGNNFHPHTEGLSSDAFEILERHELYADITLYTSIAALLLKILSMFIFKSKKTVIEIATALILLVSATSVAITGHWGAYLTHIEGVGPKGRFLENNE